MATFLKNILHRSGKTTLNKSRVASFSLALIIYGCFGSPTPDTLNITEITIAILLLLALTPEHIAQSLSLKQTNRTEPWKRAAKIFLIYGASIPLITAALQGNSITLILRDLIPFLFLFLPLFYHHIAGTPQRIQYLLAFTVFIGLSFSLRSIAQNLADILSISALQTLNANPLHYLANTPTVLFTALFLAGFGGQRLTFHHRTKKNITQAVIYFTLTILPLMAMALVLQRASIGLFMLISAIWLGLAIWKRPYHALWIIVPLLITAILLWSYITPIAINLTEKSKSVGLNMRSEELWAVWKAISNSPLTLLFGSGWGGTFHSPAVGNLSVNFTHSLLSSLLLKTGIAGLILGLLYLTELSRIILNSLKSKPILALALSAPFIIDIFLYASFKSLDFGLILLLIVSLQNTNKEKNHL